MEVTAGSNSDSPWKIHHGPLQAEIRFPLLVHLGLQPRSAYFDTEYLVSLIPKMPSLLTLPMELRLVMLRYAIPEVANVEVRDSSPGAQCYQVLCPNPALSMMLTCRQLFAEVSAVPPPIIIISFYDIGGVRACMEKMSPAMARYVKRAVLKWRGAMMGSRYLDNAKKFRLEREARELSGLTLEHLDPRFPEVWKEGQSYTWSQKRGDILGLCPYILQIVWRVSGSH